MGKQPNARETVIQGFVQAGMPGFLQGGFEAKDFVVPTRPVVLPRLLPFRTTRQIIPVNVSFKWTSVYGILLFSGRIPLLCS